MYLTHGPLTFIPPPPRLDTPLEFGLSTVTGSAPPIFRRLSTLAVMTVQGGGCSKGAPPPFQPAGLPLFSRGHARRNGIHHFQLARTTTGQQLTVEETGVPVKNQWPIPPRNLGESGEMHGSRRGSIFSSSIKDERKRKVGAAHDESSLATRVTNLFTNL